MNEAIAVSYLDLLVAALLVLVAGLVSLALRLGLGRQLALASVRTVVQLLLVGYVLVFVFGQRGWLAILAMGAVMVTAAARAAVRRPSRTYRGASWQAFATLLVTGLTVTLTVTAVIIDVDPWYEARYFVPLLGMVLGNTLTGVSLGLDSLLGGLVERRHLVEAELALGATAWEAARPEARIAVRRGIGGDVVDGQVDGRRGGDEHALLQVEGRHGEPADGTACSQQPRSKTRQTATNDALQPLGRDHQFALDEEQQCQRNKEDGQGQLQPRGGKKPREQPTDDDEDDGWDADVEQQRPVYPVAEERNLADVAGEMEDGRDAQHRMKVEEEIGEWHKEHRGPEPANGSHHLGQQGEEQEQKIDGLEHGSESGKGIPASIVQDGCDESHRAP